MNDNEEQMSCPFCGYKARGDYQIMLHLETQHNETGDSPFMVRDDASIAAMLAVEDSSAIGTPEEENYASCPIEGCGEAILLTELESHIELHAEERSGVENNRNDGVLLDKESKQGSVDIAGTFDTKLSYALRNLVNDKDTEKFSVEESSKTGEDKRQEHAKAIWKELLKMPDVNLKPAIAKSPTKKSKRRLGKAELGPHANEKQMPSWLFTLLESDGEVKIVNRIDPSDGKLKKFRTCPNMEAGVVPVLAQLLEQDDSTQYAYTCDPSVKHISKLQKEGGFCGYRNIQMMSSYIITTKSQGYRVFDGKIPTIFQIQEYIEAAWDLGINAQGRIETGGIRGTRKYIGTPDAQAMMCSLGIACDAQGLKSKKDGNNAYELLFAVVERYFGNGCQDYGPKVRRTALSPVYFQHPGHSMTIVGFEKKTDGSKNLIVFDPMFHDATNVLKLVNQNFKLSAPEELLKAYRRGLKYLKRYSDFELLKITPPQPTVQANRTGKHA